MFDARKHGFGRDEFLRVPWEFSDNKWNTMPNLVNWAFSGWQNFVVFLGAAQLFFWNSAAQCVISWRSVTLKCLDLLGGFSVFDVFLQESLKKHIQVDMEVAVSCLFFCPTGAFFFEAKPCCSAQRWWLLSSCWNHQTKAGLAMNPEIPGNSNTVWIHQRLRNLTVARNPRQSHLVKPFCGVSVLDFRWVFDLKQLFIYYYI